jgi:nitrite reductase/ring-hydroxylating ferredoxin subunit
VTAAYLGGDLVFNIGYAVNHHAFQAPPTNWAPALLEGQLREATLTRAQVEGVPILLYRRGSTITAISETCSHAGGPLAEGRVEAGSVICPWHASRYDLITGRVQGGPATISAVRYEVRVQNGRIEVKRSAETLQPS